MFWLASRARIRFARIACRSSPPATESLAPCMPSLLGPHVLLGATLPLLVLSRVRKSVHVCVSTASLLRPHTRASIGFLLAADCGSLFLANRRALGLAEFYEHRGVLSDWDLLRADQNR